MRRIHLAVAVFALAATTHSLHAQRGRGGPPGPGGGPPGGMMRCMESADSLTDTQKAQVKALSDAYVAAHKSSLDSLRAIMEAARAAREAGQTQEQVRAIMDQSRAINEALAPARKEYAESVIKLLSPSQIASGCVPPAPGGGPMGGRGRGGPPRQPPT